MQNFYTLPSYPHESCRGFPLLLPTPSSPAWLDDLDVPFETIKKQTTADPLTFHRKRKLALTATLFPTEYPIELENFTN